MAVSAIPERLSNELSHIRRYADELARNRREPLGSVHLLCALSNQPGPVADLLLERNLTHERLLGSSPNTMDSKAGSLERTFAKARELGRRMGAAEPGSAHLLMALLADNGSAARRAIDSLGVDIARFRSVAWNLGLGYPSRRRVTSAGQTAPAASQASNATPDSRSPSSSGAAPKRRSTPGVTIPLFPPQSDTGKRKLGPAQPLSVIPERASHGKKAHPPAPTAKGTPTATPADATTTTVVAPSEAPQTIARPNPRKAKRHADSFDLDPKRFPLLCAFGRNLTAQARELKLDPVVGREREMEQVFDILAKRHSNNPCLVGPSGVGKTSIVRGLALRIARQERTHGLDERVIVEVPVSDLLAGTGVRGALAQRISALRSEVRQGEGRLVVFFDEIHLLFSGDAADESGGEMKLALSRGEFPCIGATTTEEYRKSIEADPALARRFSAIDVEEPSRNDAHLALHSAARKLMTYHSVQYTDEALGRAVDWSIRYLPGRHLPDKAISIIDLAGARSRRRGHPQVAAEQVAEVVAEMGLIPVERLLETDAERFLNLEKTVAERVVGHETSIRKICSILRRNAAGLGSSRPIGTFLLLGPTGVGKTETAKAFAQALFHSETALVRLDMAEYSEPHAVARLIGAPPGYVGHDSGGQLTEAIRKRPYQVVLLDEIEKAHPEVLQSFLAVFDEGRLTDGKGRTVDFRNTIILLTSNLGAEHTSTRPKRRVGFGQGEDAATPEFEELVIASARARLSPELYNRLDEVLVFSTLSRQEVREIARRLLEQLGKSLKTRGSALSVTDAAVDHLVEQGGFDVFLGARPMKRTIARLIEAPLADRLLAGTLGPEQRLCVDVADDQLRFTVESQASR